MKRIMLLVMSFVIFNNQYSMEQIELNVAEAAGSAAAKAVAGQVEKDLEAAIPTVPGLDLNQLEEDIATQARTVLEAKFGDNEERIQRILPHLTNLFVEKAKSPNAAGQAHVAELRNFSARAKTSTVPLHAAAATTAQPKPATVTLAPVSGTHTTAATSSSLGGTIASNLENNAQLQSLASQLPASLENSIIQAMENGWTAEQKQKYGWIVTTGVTAVVGAGGITLSTLLAYYLSH